MQTVEFITSYLTFYLKGKIQVDKNFVKFEIPNTILKLIPLGKASRSLPVNQISSVDDSFKLNFKSLLWGIFFLLLGLGMLGDNTFYGIVISIYAILTILSSFETILLVNSTSGAVTVISFVIFEKAKAIECKDRINLLITGHLSDTNVREQNMKLMDNADKNTEKIIDALKK